MHDGLMISIVVNLGGSKASLRSLATTIKDERWSL
jgi:hypothetical protein